MFGISTAWKSSKIRDGIQLIDELEQTGIPGVELDYRISAAAFQQIKNHLKTSKLTVLSLHNYCPCPDILPIEKATGDAFRLSALDEQERKLAIQYSIQTIRHAHELGAGAVVFHLGHVEIAREADRWFSFVDDGKFQTKAGKEFLQQKLIQRQQAKAPYFEALLDSLDRLNHEAERLNILIGVENRYYFEQLPNYHEIGLILDHFQGGKIGYWHDVGHAQTSEVFHIGAHEQFLKSYSKQLIGVHLHDAQKVGYNDHFAPGSGLIDFDMIKKYLPDHAIRIIEAHPKVSAEELQRGVQFLKQKKIISLSDK